ncbi:PREDICTED: cyclic GMP-AMP synthase [Chrysochloris asiatica]|uniref:Cyclic GMP-AMP synthase n=1 Tax=Chrysochloris asiatica TaxID=185453 RepID=A0A9B0WK05_CHRAS|nr:PREDICTED: cyclic GMP-AMP synthase [Chrysochloris asiatica]
MDAQRVKDTRTSKKAGAATPKGSTRNARGAQAEPTEFPPASGNTQLCPGSCSPSGESLRKNMVQGPLEKPQVRSLGARGKKAPISARDPKPSDDADAVRLEGREATKGPAERQDSYESQKPPVVRAGSRRLRGSGSVRERRSAPRLKELPSPGPLVSAPSLDRSESAPREWKPRVVLDRLRLSRPEITMAAETVNKVVDHLLRKLQCFEFKGISPLRAGSYYERVKVSAPNEFDVMFKLEVERIQLEEYGDSGAFYFVKFKRNPKGNPLRRFLEGEILSASKMLSKFREVIKEEIKNIEDITITLQRKKRGSPAVTLLIRTPIELSVDIILALESKGSWPASTQEGLPINNWLGAKVRTELRRQPYCLVPKHAKEGTNFQEETWRLSFSHIEKDILKNHGQSKTCCENDGVKCCRKDCLKLMKYLLEQLKKKFENRKELDKFCSYHVKTAFFHVCTQDPHDSQWHSKDLVQCFDNYVTYFLQCLRTEQLKHYFIPGYNLFSPNQIGKVNKEFLSRQIEYEKDNGFPLFLEF